MKKIYTLLVVLGLATTTFAQGYDLQVYLSTPVSASSVAPSAAVSVEFALTNNGPTAIASGDTIWMSYLKGSTEVYDFDNTAGGASGFILNSEIPSGSSIPFGPFDFDLSGFATGDTVIVLCWGVNGDALTAAGDPNETDPANNLDLFFIDGSAAINELEAEVVVFPNPTTDVLNVKTTSVVRSISVIGLDGRNVLFAENTNSINVSALKPGNYIYKVETESGAIITNTFVKQ